MFPRTYFPGSMFAPSYFPPVTGGVAPTVTGLIKVTATSRAPLTSATSRAPRITVIGRPA